MTIVLVFRTYDVKMMTGGGWLEVVTTGIGVVLLSDEDE